MIFEDLRFGGAWRRYQELALDAFADDLAAGRDRTYIVAPPGSGKTLIGMEIVRRLGRPALVLAPNSAVQTQWIKAAEQFGAPAGTAVANVDAPLACLTYQALCQLNDPGEVLSEVAERRWAEQRGAAVASSVAEVIADSRSWSGAALRRRDAEIAQVTATLKREIARSPAGASSLLSLLAPGARQRIQRLAERRVGTVVLDECHHLASLWGYVVRAVLSQLGDVHVVGLTATPPTALTSDEQALYKAILGSVDFQVPTPAVVRDRCLAPYQELAWFTRPLESETQWLSEREIRFQELVTTLHDPSDTYLSLPEWILQRTQERKREAGEGAELSWAAFQRAHPALARASAKYLNDSGLPLPRGAPNGEGYRERPSLDDWIVLLSDYALRCLAPDPAPEAAARYSAIGDALRALGFTLSRRGIQRAASDVDRLLLNSQAKRLALADVLSLELDSRSSSLRALVLTDTEQGARESDVALAGVLDPFAGTAPSAVLAIVGDERTAPLRPLLVSGRGLRCAPSDAEFLIAELARLAGDRLGGWHETETDGLCRIYAGGGDWQTGVWVELATRLFQGGATRVLVGTRGLLGEGWDSPCVNCLVDLTQVTTSMSVTQMRGRSLRLDPADPEKLSSNWDIVCVAPELAQGAGDYARFVRRHNQLFAPSEDGVIEQGPSHVHPDLGPVAPPPDAAFATINQAMMLRSADRNQARTRWRIGEPYESTELETLLIKPRTSTPRTVSEAEPAGFHLPASRGPIGIWKSIGRIRRLDRELPTEAPLDLIARAICDTSVKLRELSPAGATSLVIEPRSSGYLRCYLTQATPEENERFTRALDEVLASGSNSRYLVSRLLPGSEGWPRLSLAYARDGDVPFLREWLSVPSDFGRRRSRAEAFHAAFERWLGPSELLYTRDDAGRDIAVSVDAGRSRYITSRRRIWR